MESTRKFQFWRSVGLLLLATLAWLFQYGVINTDNTVGWGICIIGCAWFGVGFACQMIMRPTVVNSKGVEIASSSTLAARLLAFAMTGLYVYAAVSENAGLLKTIHVLAVIAVIVQLVHWNGVDPDGIDIKRLDALPV